MRGIDAAAGGGFDAVVLAMTRDGHISERASQAAAYLIADLRAAARSPANLVAGYNPDRVQSSAQAFDAPTGQRALDAWQRACWVLDRLSAHERRVLNQCILSGESGRSPLTHIGRMLSRFENAKSCKAYGVAAVVGLCERILALHEASPQGRILQASEAA